MQHCKIEIQENEVEAGAVLAMIQAEKPDAASAVLVEAKTYARLIPFEELDTVQIADCLRIVVASSSMEMRFEKQQLKKDFFVRILREQEGDEYRYRDDRLLLRSSSSIAKRFYKQDNGTLTNREYYRSDDDGMLVFYADRLATGREG